MKKNIRKLRTMRFFIDAAKEILEEEGADGLTIRKVADRAGYNSATLYGYFENLEHLSFYASLSFLRTYLVRLAGLPNPKDALERFTVIWRCFVTEAFQNPQYYYNIFYSPHRFQFNDSVRIYYQIYPEELQNLSEDLLPMLLETNIYKRDYEALKRCSDQGYIREQDIPDINDILVLLFQSYLLRVKNEPGGKSSEEHAEILLGYFVSILNGYAAKTRPE